MRAIAVRSLGAGSDKGETGLRLPLRLLFVLAGLSLEGLCNVFVLFCVCLFLSQTSFVLSMCLFRSSFPLFLSDRQQLSRFGRWGFPKHK